MLRLVVLRRVLDEGCHFGPESRINPSWNRSGITATLGQSLEHLSQGCFKFARRKLGRIKAPLLLPVPK
jgi:hypothetical protein